VKRSIDGIVNLSVILACVVSLPCTTLRALLQSTLVDPEFLAFRRGSLNQACALLLAAVGRELSDPTPVRGDAPADLGVNGFNGLTVISHQTSPA
jgi:hypothetical protein